MPISKLVSGAQTGADQAGLAAGVTLGLQPGGWAPKGWMTEDGAAPWLAKFGVKEHSQFGYSARTRANVRDSDATFWFGNPGSPGGKLTLRTASEMGKPVFIQIWPPAWTKKDAMSLRQWVEQNEVGVLNVAGNREHSNPGIGQACHDFLVTALR